MMFELFDHFGVHVRHFVDDVDQPVALGVAQRTGPTHLIKQVRRDIRQDVALRGGPGDDVGSGSDDTGGGTPLAVVQLAVISVIWSPRRP